MRQACAEALALYPGAPSAHLALASFERRLGNRAAAGQSVRELLETPPGATPDPRTTYYAAGDGRRAETLLDALRVDVLVTEDGRPVRDLRPIPAAD